MPQCKRDGCREPALDYGARTGAVKKKQYCAEHFAEYKQGVYKRLKREREAPKCERCGHRPLMSAHCRETGVCPECEEEVEEERARADADAREYLLRERLEETLGADVLEDLVELFELKHGRG